MFFRKPPVGLALSAALTLAAATGCDDYLDVNTDPVNPTEVNLSQLLPVTQAAISTHLGQNVNGLGQPTSAIVQQLTNFRVGTFDQLSGTSFNNAWVGLYTDAMSNNERIITQGTASGDWTYVGIAQIQKAYTFSQMVDVWGDIPYSEALRGENNLTPKFDPAQEIYAQLFPLIDEGIRNLRRAAPRRPGGDDLVYGGNPLTWIRLGYALKLKLYNQVRLVQAVGPQVAAILSKPDSLMQPTGGDYEFRYNTNLSPDNRHLGFIGDYVAGQPENQISRYFYQTMKGSLPANSGGITTPDPRIPYYFFSQAPRTGPSSTRLDYVEAPGVAAGGTFVTTRFGTTGIFAGDASINTNATLQGLYPVGGRFDLGTGGARNGSAGLAGAAAQRLLPFYSQRFTEAELQLTVLSNKPAALTALTAAVRAAFAKVNSVAAQAAVATIPAATIDTYVAQMTTRFNAAADPLEVILTEKYIASFGFGMDAYTDYRRTGYPKIQGAGDGPANTLAQGLYPDNDPETQQRAAFPVRLPYRLNDLLTNPKAPAQPNIYTSRLFWDPS